MKRFWTILALALCLGLIFPLAAGAAGNAIIARESHDGFEDYVDAICAVENTLWMQGGNQVYSYDTQTGEMTAWPWTGEYAEAKGGLYDEGYKVYWGTEGWFSWNGGVYTLRTITRMNDDYSYYELEDVTLCRVLAQEGGVSLEEVQKIDYRAFVEGTHFGFNSCCVVNDVLCGSSYLDMGGTGLMLIPLNGEEPSLIYLNDLDRICAYDGGLLTLQVKYNGDSNIEQYSLMDVSTGKSQKLFERETSGGWSAGLVQEAGSSRVLLVKEGRLSALDLSTGETEILTSFPITTDSSGGAEACMLPNGVYAAGGYMGVALRDLANPVENECELNIGEITWSENVDSSIISFGQSHPEISVVRTMPDADTALTQLLTRSSEVDIYVMDSHYDGLFSAILEREWGAPLSGSPGLSSYAEALYPTLAQTLTGSDGLFAVLLDSYPMGLGINVQCLEMLGLTMEDVPTNWPDFLDFLGSIATEDCPVPIGLNWWDAQDVYRDLAECILETYSLEVACGASEGYDTPELRAALEALDRLDCQALYDISQSHSDFYGNPLLSSYNGVGVDDCTFEDEIGYYHFRLSISADRPIRMPVEGYVAIVNPASEHIDQALLFLEEMVAQISAQTMATICPDVGQPAMRSDYQEERQNQEDRVASLKARLESAAEADKQMIEGELTQAEDWLNIMESYFWEISPQSLEWYRAHDDYVMLRVAGELEEMDLYTLLRQIAEEDPAQRTAKLIAELQRQADMRRLEAGR